MKIQLNSSGKPILRVYRKPHLEVLVDKIAYDLADFLLFSDNEPEEDVKEPKDPECFTPIWVIDLQPVNTEALVQKGTIPAMFIWLESTRRTDSFPGVIATTNQEIEIALIRIQVLFKNNFGPPDENNEAKDLVPQATGLIDDINFILSNYRIRSAYDEREIQRIYDITDAKTILPNYKNYVMPQVRLELYKLFGLV